MKLLPRAACPLALALLLGAAPAHAGPGDPSEVTVVRTHDGGVFRGRIVEKVPGKYVTLELATGETRRIEWGAIEGESDGESRDARAAEPPSGGDGRAESTPATVTFTADSENAQIERSVEGYWVTVCDGPGTCRLPAADGIYRVNGKGVVTSRPFQLSPQGSRVDAEVGTTGTTAGGVILMAVGGGAALFIGLPLLLAGAVLSSASDPGTNVDTTGVTTAGAVITIGGVVAGIAGLVMILNNNTTVKTSQALPGTRLAGTPGSPRLTGASPLGFVF